MLQSRGTLVAKKRETPPKLLLLFGSPRSGTSWVGKILDSHPLTLYKHEPDRSGFELPLVPSMDSAEQWRSTIERFIAEIVGNNSHHASARLPVFRKSYRTNIGHAIHHASVVTSGGAAVFNWKVPVLQCLDAHHPELCVIWKSTDSLGRIGVILSVLDHCRAIHLIRHPCGYVSSVLRGEAAGKFITKAGTPEDYETICALVETPAARRRGLTVDHFRRFHPIERLAWIWVLINEKAEHDSRTDPRYMCVRYEDICRDPIKQSKGLFSFLGLEWSTQTAEFIHASTLGRRPTALNRITQDSRRYYSIFRNPLQSAEKWKSEMKAQDIERVFRIVKQSDLAKLYAETQSLQACNQA